MGDTMNTARISGLILATAAASMLPGITNAQVVNACVNRNSGDVRIVSQGTACPNNAYPLQWNQPQSIPVPPPPQLHTQIIYGGPIPGTWIARAYCPQTWMVTGGGGFGRHNTPIVHNHPIATTDGEVAGDQNAIGWQVGVASEDEVQAYAICAKVY
jgi:hypothetical protein